MFIKRKLNDDDLLAKYVFRLKDLRADGSPRPSNLKPKNGEKLSMSEVTKLRHDETCEHGHTNVDNPSKNRVQIGYVKFRHESLIRIKLETIYDNKPPRHVSVKFPKDPEKRREFAKALANEVIVINKEARKKYFAACG